MTSRDRGLLVSALAIALSAFACEPVSVPPWPYTISDQDAAAPDDGATEGASSDAGPTEAASDGSSDQSESSGGIASNYPPSPLRCDGGLCDTDNYSLCSVADDRSANGARQSLSLLAGIAAIATAWTRTRRKVRRRS